MEVGRGAGMAEIGVYQWLLGIGTVVVSASVGFLLKSVTGENRASVRKIDADASKSYSEAATNTARMMVDLQVKVEALTARVDILEKEKDDLQNQVVALQVENAQLRSQINKRGLASR